MFSSIFKMYDEIIQTFGIPPHPEYPPDWDFTNAPGTNGNNSSGPNGQNSSSSWWDPFAKLGFPSHTMVMKCQHGDDLKAKKQYADAFKAYLSEARCGDRVCMYRVAQCYDYGIGVAISKTMAMKWYQDAAARAEGTDDGFGCLEPARVCGEWLEQNPEFVKMVDGKPYDPTASCLETMRSSCRKIVRNFNASGGNMDILRPLLRMNEGVLIDAPFMCDYGENVLIGGDTRIAASCLILDSAPVYIGSNVTIGHNVHIYTATHPRSYRKRNASGGLAKSVSIGNGVHIGSNVVICPGASIGDGARIGAGAVVRGTVQAGETIPEVSSKAILNREISLMKKMAGASRAEIPHAAWSPFSAPGHKQWLNQRVQAANSGDAQACFEVAMCYDEGRGVEYSKHRAKEYFDRSRRLRHAEAGARYDWLCAHEAYIRMADGKPYYPWEPSLMQMQMEAARAVQEFGETEDPGIPGRAMHMEGAFITPPLTWKFGSNIFMGQGTYVNKCCEFDDSAPIFIGQRVFFGPGVRIITSRDMCDASGDWVARPVVIEDNCWICGKVTIHPGVKIGSGSVVAAGAVVTEDVPPNTLVEGNPAKVKERIKQD